MVIYFAYTIKTACSNEKTCRCDKLLNFTYYIHNKSSLLLSTDINFILETIYSCITHTKRHASKLLKIIVFTKPFCFLGHHNNIIKNIVFK